MPKCILIIKSNYMTIPAGFFCLVGTELNQKIKSSLYWKYYSEARYEWWDPSPRLGAWATQLRNPKKYRSGGESLATLRAIFRPAQGANPRPSAPIAVSSLS